MRPVCVLLFLIVSCVPCFADTPAPRLVLQQGDHIAIIGNTLADRMQHDGWLETRIQAHFPDHHLVFRNLGYPGDELKQRVRAENFGSPDEWLTRVKADVIFAFFGFNESFDGEAGLPTFERDLHEVIDGMLSQKYNGRSAPRLVMFSPIAHENLHSPHLPDGSENNRNLERYTAVMQKVCREKQVLFVDLFHPTRRMYEQSAEPLTMNGIHLQENGNRLLADHIVRELFGVDPAAGRTDAEWETLRQTVLDRNLYWFSRYRVVDEYNVFGGRSKLEWFGQSNADVMMREMEIFDVMTANRDVKIWATARGSRHEVRDDNLPEPLPVRTNKPGPLEGGRFEYLRPEQTLESFTLADGLEANVFASEEMFPEMINPVQMAVDPDGRLFVSVWPSYPHWNPVEPRRDRILCLPDEDGDGVADECRVFADELNSVTGLEFWGGGLLVAAPPEIWFLKDTDGDDVADEKIRMLQGVSSADTHHSANAMVIGADGGLYWSRGIFNVASMETPTGPYRSTRSGVHRFDPRTFQMSFLFPIGPNPHGHVIDQWGYHFANDGTTGTGSYINIGRGIGNRHWFKKRVRPVAATGILSSSHFPDSMQGNFLICNCIGVLGVLQHEVRYNGAEITAHEIEPILLADDPNFRPTDLEIGGDGALYVSDWSNALIGHMQHNIRDPNRDHEHGRIFRITAAGRPLVRQPKMKGRPAAEVCETFFSPVNGFRYRARLELSSRSQEEIRDQVGRFADALDPLNDRHAQALLECLWVFEEQRIPNRSLLVRVFSAREPRVRAAAIRTLGRWAGRIEHWEPLLRHAAEDESPLVRAEAVKAAVLLTGEAACEAVCIVAGLPRDPELDIVLEYARRELELDRLVRDAVAEKRGLTEAGRRFALQYAPPEDLLLLDPAEDVFLAVLSRDNTPPAVLQKALEGLAKLRGDSSLSVLVDLLETRATAGGPVAAWSSLLGAVSAERLKTVRNRLQKLAVSGGSSEVRQAAWAAWVRADNGVDDAWLAASRTERGRKDFLAAVPDIHDESLRTVLFDIIRSLLFSPAANDDALRDLAVNALGAVPGHTEQKVSALARLMKRGQSRPRVIQVLARIPVSEWPSEEIRPLAENLVGYLSAMPSSLRTGTEAKAAAALVKSLIPRLPPAVGSELQERLENLDVRVIALGTVPARMIYDKEVLVVQAGRPVEFRFTNSDHMPHNFVIVQPGSLEEVGLLAEATARDPDAHQRHYVPRSDRILLSSRLLQPGQTQALTFDVPRRTGVYPYVCTYPGHWRRMFGALYVVDDLEAYLAHPDSWLAEHPLPIQDELLKMAGRRHEWTFAELIDSVRGMKHGRSFEVGRQLFRVAGCVSCHRLAGEGQVFGPDLAKLDDKKRTADHILESLLDPSVKIDDAFRSWTFVLSSGRTVTGMIVKETGDQVHVVIDPLARTAPVVLSADEIDDRVKSDVSLMPKGLLNRLNPEEILDLMAYVLSAGDSDDPLFQGAHDHGNPEEPRGKP